MKDVIDILPGAAKKMEHNLPDFLDTKNKTQFEKFRKKGQKGLKLKLAPKREHIPFSFNPEYQSASESFIHLHTHYN